jgi:hypothetical protein
LLSLPLVSLFFSIFFFLFLREPPPVAVWHPNGEYFVVPTKSQGELFFSRNDWMVEGKDGGKWGGFVVDCVLTVCPFQKSLLLMEIVGSNKGRSQQMVMMLYVFFCDV